MQVMWFFTGKPYFASIDPSPWYYCLCCLWSWATPSPQQDSISSSIYQLPSIFISSFVPNLIEYYNEHHFQFVDFFFQRTDSSWKKSSSRYIMTSYFQPLLLWTGAMLICRFVCFWIDKYTPPKVLIVLIMALFVSGH